ncbi:MAG: DUF4870 domain-containing protein [Planctomycetota bacterium]|nr:DUF4870 domain-containing protein [Planctomycetota bacterium]
MEERAVRQWCMFMHLGQFAGYASPLAGVIVPIVLWRTRAREREEIDEHGRMIVNALLSFFCYWITAIILCFVVIGIPLVFVLGIASIAFPIIGAIKADEGVLWRYPLIIYFL